MLDEIFYIHTKTVENVPLSFRRYLYDTIDWDSGRICITGARGVGKTTMLLQHYHREYGDVEKCLYISADNVEICALGLFNSAKEYFKYGGRALIIDEIHKYPSWQIELKNIVDTFKDRKIMISGSSSLDLQKGKADLSRRMVYYSLKGLSFREYLRLQEKIDIPAFKLEDVMSSHVAISQDLIKKGPILKFFKDYLIGGYYPFFTEGPGTYLSKVLNIIEKVLYEDIAVTGNIKKTHIFVLKKILWLIATSVPFKVNISKMSRELGISKEYIYIYLEYLEKAALINAMRPAGKAYKMVRKAEKMFIENTNLLLGLNNFLRSESEQGAVRETFFVNQLKDSEKISLSDRGDFAVGGRYTIEVGGKDKKSIQIKGIKDAYIAADRIEIGYGNKVPLYLFGMLY
ncbi:MAG: AAA family ATPase [Candidatus Omnitrophota bacterium]